MKVYLFEVSGITIFYCRGAGGGIAAKAITYLIGHYNNQTYSYPIEFIAHDLKDFTSRAQLLLSSKYEEIVKEFENYIINGNAYKCNLNGGDLGLANKDYGTYLQVV